MAYETPQVEILNICKSVISMQHSDGRTKTINVTHFIINDLWWLVPFGYVLLKYE